MRLALEDPNNAISTAFDCKTAIATCSSERPDIVVTDLSLGDGSGAELALHARSCGIGLVVGVTGYDRSHLQKIGTDLSGFSHFLTKPLDLSQLCAVVEKYRSVSKSN